MAQILQVSIGANIVRERGSDHYLLAGRKDSRHICLITPTLSLSWLLCKAADHSFNSVSKVNLFFFCAGRRKVNIEQHKQSVFCLA